MAEQEMMVLLASAASLGLIHTVFGPDHYVPFVMMGKAGNWSLRKTCLITVLCGIGHVMGSVVLGLIGIAIGIGIHRIELIEGLRGNIAAWLFIGLGLAYFAWGLKKALRNKPHSHFHVHPDGIFHSHTHTHEGSHLHAHADSATVPTKGDMKGQVLQSEKKNMSLWILFVIFIFGPCEPLIPLLMYPAAKLSTAGVLAVSLTFMLFTVGTMTLLVGLAYAGARSIRWGWAERYMHALAGFTLFLCGVSIAFLGL
ncbi:MAG: hypothetical protein V2I46_02630 [Bacteroides sp.]|jgi:hypothetical protein|nr:hypothetical protein [Bacteroides sp.]